MLAQTKKPRLNDQFRPKTNSTLAISTTYHLQEPR